MPWSELETFLTPRFVQAHELTDSMRRANKHTVPLYSPGIFLDWSGPRTIGNVENVQLLVYDLDFFTQNPETQFAEFMKRLRDSAYLYIVHTTYTHTPPHKYAYRLIMSLEKPVSIDSFRTSRAHLFDYLRPPAMRSIGDDANRMFFYPSTHVSRQEHFFLESGGKNFAPTVSYNTHAATKPTPVLPIPDSEDFFDEKTYRRELQRRVKKLEFDHPIRDLLSRMLEGNPLAPPGQRDDALTRLVGYLVAVFPSSTAVSSYLALLDDSLVKMSGGPNTDDYNNGRKKLEDKIRRFHSAKQADQSRFKDEFERSLKPKRLDIPPPQAYSLPVFPKG